MARFYDPERKPPSFSSSCGTTGIPGSRMAGGRRYRRPAFFAEGKKEGVYGFGADLHCPHCGGEFDFLLIEFENSPADSSLAWGEIDLEEFDVDLLRCPQCGHRDLEPL